MEKQAYLTSHSGLRQEDFAYFPCGIEWNTGQNPGLITDANDVVIELVRVKALAGPPGIDFTFEQSSGKVSLAVQLVAVRDRPEDMKEFNRLAAYLQRKSPVQS